jgi:predicted transcriptional regulator
MSYYISNLVNDLHLTVLTDIYTDFPISNGYCCDMLSWAMSRLDNKSAWFTILNSMNVIAVASLSECPCIILTESVELSENVLLKAMDESICVCRTQQTTFASAACLAEALMNTKG